MKNKILISIVNTSNAEYLKKCLSSIYKKNLDENFDICVLDNASTDNSIEMLNNNFPNVFLIKNSKKLGYIENQNIILNKFYKNYKYTMLLNEDTEMITDKFLNHLIQNLESNTSVAAISPKIYYADGSIQPGGNGFTNITIYIIKILKLTRLVEKLRLKKILVKTRKFVPLKQARMYLNKFSNDQKKIQFSPVISGCCIMIKKEALDDVGILDKRFIMYADDLDWCRRASNNGWKCCYVNSVELMHHYKASFSEFTYIEEHRSMFRYLRKYNHSKYGIIFLKILSLTESVINILVLLISSIIKFKSSDTKNTFKTEINKINITFKE